MKKKINIIKKFQRNDLDTGGSEVQVAILTDRINQLKKHFDINKKDNHSRLGLLKMISARKKHLKYLKRKHFDRYKSLIFKLNLRK